jgi:hypothetical protein
VIILGFIRADIGLLVDFFLSSIITFDLSLDFDKDGFIVDLKYISVIKKRKKMKCSFTYSHL